MNQVPVDPRRILDVFVERKGIDPTVPVAGQEVAQAVVPVATGDDRPHAGLRNGFLRQRRHVVADKDHLIVMVGDPRPVPFDNRCLRLNDDVVRLERGKPFIKRLRLQLGGDAIEKQDLVPGLLQHRRGRRGNDRKDVGRMREPLELPILSEKGNALLTLQRRICNRDSHVMTAT